MFTHLEGIGKRLNERLYKANVRDYVTFLELKEFRGMSKKRLMYYKRRLQSEQKLLNSRNYSNLHHLPSKILYQKLSARACFVDLESDKRGVYCLTISTKLSDTTFVRGFNLSVKSVQTELNKFDLIITYNGQAYDLPKLRDFGVKISQPHIDLKSVCARLGLKGGLKDIERQLKITRRLEGSPIQLWRAYHASGDKEYLDLLVEYNQTDASNLFQLSEICFKR